MYITGASFWELDWKQAYDYFSQVGSGWPSMWDRTMTGLQRLQYSAMRYGDDLYEQKEYCAAYEQYQIAAGIGNLDDTSSKNSNQAYQQCYPATEIPPTTEIITPVDTIESPTEAPTAAPTP
ncbi:MAG: hypothetical protein Q7T89_08200, partial [Anaerolineales bacterium]|nr:hypothetical protein [Anaerolineales bacterium]